MIEKREHERMRTLIADTVSLLCKNGLHYTKEFCIEGLLGITLDRDEVFLINIKEIDSPRIQQDSDSEQSGAEANVSSKLVKQTRLVSTSKSESECYAAQSVRLDMNDIDDYSNNTNVSIAPKDDVDNSSAHPRQKSCINEESSQESSNDLVFSKDGMGEGTSSFLADANESFSAAQSNNFLGDLSQNGSSYDTSVPLGSLITSSPRLDPPATFSQQSNEARTPTMSGWDQSQSAATEQLSQQRHFNQRSTPEQLHMTAAVPPQQLPVYPNTTNTSEQQHCTSAISPQQLPVPSNTPGQPHCTSTVSPQQLPVHPGSTPETPGQPFSWRCTFEGCSAILKSKSGLYSHIKRHKGIYPYYCPYCKKGKQSMQNVKSHIKSTHTGLYGFHCLGCRKEFVSVHALRSHLQTCAVYIQNEQTKNE